jgi:hypothetical protein
MNKSYENLSVIGVIIIIIVIVIVIIGSTALRGPWP